MKQNKPMTAREEFLQMMSCLSVEVDSKEGAEKALDKIYNWHISEMEKLLERVEAIIWSFSKYEISGNNGKYIDEELLKKVIQSLNKLKKEK